MRAIYEFDRDVSAGYEVLWSENDLHENLGRVEGDQSVEQILEDLGGDTSLRILDIGCGMGRVAERLRDHGYEPVGIDIAVSGLRAYKGMRPAAPLVAGSAARLPFADESFDVVLIMGVLYELPDAQTIADALTDARRVVRPGGRVVYVSQYPKDAWKVLLSWVPFRSRLFRRLAMPGRVDSRVCFSKWVISNREVLHFFEAAGLAVETVRPLNPYYGISAWFKDFFYKRPPNSRGTRFEADREPRKYVTLPGRLIAGFARRFYPMLCPGLVLFRTAPVDASRPTDPVSSP